ncbi:hypothetical protein EV426DRAFT_572732 [Tirmania nivea]|nr:hypothetical protein EV426DRAFT_572732 [Tirmania nivea]
MSGHFVECVRVCSVCIRACTLLAAGAAGAGPRGGGGRGWGGRRKQEERGGRKESTVLCCASEVRSRSQVEAKQQRGRDCTTDRGILTGAVKPLTKWPQGQPTYRDSRRDSRWEIQDDRDNR